MILKTNDGKGYKLFRYHQCNLDETFDYENWEYVNEYIFEHTDDNSRINVLFQIRKTVDDELFEFEIITDLYAIKPGHHLKNKDDFDPVICAELIKNEVAKRFTIDLITNYVAVPQKPYHRCNECIHQSTFKLIGSCNKSFEKNLHSK